MLRVEMGQSLRAFAKAYGFSEDMLIRIERGHAYVPEPWRDRLAAALGVSVDEILDSATGLPKFREARRGEAH
jgi:transcriptional regulator with XRE-family HTH domain